MYRKSKMKMPRKLFLLIIALLLIIITVLGYAFKTNNNKLLQVSTKGNTEVSSKKNKANLRIEYFDDAVGVWGSGSPSGETQWKAIDSRYAQRSAPTAIIHPLELKQESIKLRPVKRSEIKYQSRYSGEKEPEYYKLIVDDMYTEYGELLSGYFASKGEVITSSKEFDVDNDRIKDQAVETVTIGGNHPPYSGYIIKNGVIILSMPLNSGGIEPAKDGNGFYVQHKVYDDQGLCCPLGYRLYRVVYKDNSFKPVWEQEVKYIRVNMGNGITKEEAVEIVKNLPEAKDFLQSMKKINRKTLVEADRQKADQIVVHVAEINDDNLAATFNWYILDENTGAIKCSFSNYQGTKYIGNNDKYPCD